MRPAGGDRTHAKRLGREVDPDGKDPPFGQVLRLDRKTATEIERPAPGGKPMLLQGLEQFRRRARQMPPTVVAGAKRVLLVLPGFSRRIRSLAQRPPVATWGCADLKEPHRGADPLRTRPRSPRPSGRLPLRSSSLAHAGLACGSAGWACVSERLSGPVRMETHGPPSGLRGQRLRVLRLARLCMGPVAGHGSVPLPARVHGVRDADVHAVPLASCPRARPSALPARATRRGMTIGRGERSFGRGSTGQRRSAAARAAGKTGVPVWWDAGEWESTTRGHTLAQGPSVRGTGRDSHRG